MQKNSSNTRFIHGEIFFGREIRRFVRYGGARERINSRESGQKRVYFSVLMHKNSSNTRFIHDFEDEGKKTA